MEPNLTVVEQNQPGVKPCPLKKKRTYSNQLKRDYCLFRINFLLLRDNNACSGETLSSAQQSFFRNIDPSFQPPVGFARNLRKWWARRNDYLSDEELSDPRLSQLLQNQKRPRLEIKVGDEAQKINVRDSSISTAEGNSEQSDGLERRVRRRISSGAADALISKCWDRSITASVVGGCTCEELMEEMGISEEAASALSLDDAAWGASVWPFFARMAEAGIAAGVIAEARAAMAGLPRTLARLQCCSPQALKDAGVSLAVRVWLRANGCAPADSEEDGIQPPLGVAATAAALPLHGTAAAPPSGAAGLHGGSAEPAGGAAAAVAQPSAPLPT